MFPPLIPTSILTQGTGTMHGNEKILLIILIYEAHKIRFKMCHK
jgi:hypothetical protein